MTPPATALSAEISAVLLAALNAPASSSLNDARAVRMLKRRDNLCRALLEGESDLALLGDLLSALSNDRELYHAVAAALGSWIVSDEQRLTDLHHALLSKHLGRQVEELREAGLADAAELIEHVILGQREEPVAWYLARTWYSPQPQVPNALEALLEAALLALTVKDDLTVLTAPMRLALGTRIAVGDIVELSERPSPALLETLRSFYAPEDPDGACSTTAEVLAVAEKLL